MYEKQLRKLNLPPEEWANEVRDLNAQLVEALEQLSAREAELDEHEELLRHYETHLGDMRAQQCSAAVTAHRSAAFTQQLVVRVRLPSHPVIARAAHRQQCSAAVTAHRSASLRLRRARAPHRDALLRRKYATARSTILTHAYAALLPCAPPPIPHPPPSPQAAVLYRDHGSALSAAQTEAARARDAAAALQRERDALAAKCRRLEALAAAEAAAEVGDDPSAPPRLLRELTRRVTVFEVNEQELARRHANMEEQLRLANEARERAEGDLIEAEAAAKTRILFLEQHRAGAAERVARLTAELERSAPAERCDTLQRALAALREDHLRLLEKVRTSFAHVERRRAALRRRRYVWVSHTGSVQCGALRRAAECALAALREDHLRLLEKEAEARLQLAQQGAAAHEAQQLRAKVAEMEEALAAAAAARGQAEAALRDNDALAAAAARCAAQQLAALQGGAAVADLGDIVEEAARFREAAAAAEVARVSAVVRAEGATARAAALDAECRALRARCASLALDATEARAAALSARDARAAVLAEYGGGATAADAAALRRRCAALEGERAALLREAERCRELADIASQQAHALGARRQDEAEELAELRRHAAALEARSDDDLLIGRLQRRLLALRGAHRALARKHEATRANLRRKAAALRLLEGHLEAREGALGALAERSRAQVAALKGALVQLADAGVTSDELQQQLNLARGRDFAERVAKMAALLAEKEAALADAEVGCAYEDMEACARSEAVAEAAAESGAAAQRLAADLQAAAAAAGPGAAAAEAARRLAALSADLRDARLAALEAARAAAALRRERRQLQAQLAARERDVGALEAAAADAAAAAIDGGGAAAAALPVPPCELDLGYVVLDDGGSLGGTGRSGAGAALDTARSALSAEERSLLEQALAPPEFDFGGLDPQQALTRLRDGGRQLVALRAALAEAAAARADAEARADAASQRSESLQRDVAFYERQARDAGLPCSAPSHGGSSGGGSGSGGGGKARLGEEEAAQLQAAAAATVASLKRLLQEKNAAIERYQRKLDEARADKRREAGADRVEVARLTNRMFQDNADALGQLRRALAQFSGAGAAALGGDDSVALSARLMEQLEEKFALCFYDGVALSARPMEQLEEVAAVLAAKDDASRQLELKLRTASNQKERAEERCGEALAEMEKMRADMATLVTQLQAAEERALEAAEDRSQERALAEARAALRERDAKLRGLRGALVRLKQEFVAAEERREEAALREELQECVAAEERREEAALREEIQRGGRSSAERPAAGADARVSALRDQMQTVQAGLLEVKGELEKARRGKERAVAARDKRRRSSAQHLPQCFTGHSRNGWRGVQPGSLCRPCNALMHAPLRTANAEDEHLTEELVRYGVAESLRFSPTGCCRCSLSSLPCASLACEANAENERLTEKLACCKPRCSTGRRSATAENKRLTEELARYKAAPHDRSQKRARYAEGAAKQDAENDAAAWKEKAMEAERKLKRTYSKRAARCMHFEPCSSARAARQSDWAHAAAAVAALAPSSLAAQRTQQQRAADIEMYCARWPARALAPPPLPQALAAQNRELRDAAAAVLAPVAEAAAREQAARVAQHDQQRRAADAERRLRRRVASLERLLAESGAAAEAAAAEAAAARAAAARAARERDALAKAAAAASRKGERGAAQGAGAGAAAGAATAAALEAARARVFELEERCAELRRAAEVEWPSQVESLKHQVRALRGRLEEADAAAEQAERRARAAEQRGGRGGGGSALAEEERLYHEAEALRDELTEARQRW
ncbi:hypothetical protein JKP88DRAFT_267883 [Tribonema minus]|uniref:Uncharacterized protein n=1 Tax=Tribonema minus TaxID=303371 RepID=A0A835Z5T3_9STRA|nr:hypothetical protein JKP88DRAFT_267883 [Tribonema minus]